MHRERFHAVRARGFTLVEATLSMLILSVVLTGGVSAISVAARQRVDARERLRAVSFAEELMREVMTKAYADPEAAVGGEAAMGLDDGEKTDRVTWDDVDDYVGLNDVPMSDELGNVIEAGWSRIVTVDWMTPLTKDEVSAAPTGVKRVVVIVKRGEKPMARLESRVSSVGQGVVRTK